MLFVRVQTEDSILGAGVQLPSLLCPLQGTLCRTILLLTVSFPGDACLGLPVAYSNTCNWVSQDSEGERMGCVSGKLLSFTLSGVCCLLVFSLLFQ